MSGLVQREDILHTHLDNGIPSLRSRDDMMHANAYDAHPLSHLSRRGMADLIVACGGNALPNSPMTDANSGNTGGGGDNNGDGGNSGDGGGGNGGNGSNDNGGGGGGPAPGPQGNDGASNNNGNGNGGGGNPDGNQGGQSPPAQETNNGDSMDVAGGAGGGGNDNPNGSDGNRGNGGPTQVAGGPAAAVDAVGAGGVGGNNGGVPNTAGVTGNPAVAAFDVMGGGGGGGGNNNEGVPDVTQGIPGGPAGTALDATGSGGNGNNGEGGAPGAAIDAVGGAGGNDNVGGAPKVAGDSTLGAVQDTGVPAGVPDTTQGISSLCRRTVVSTPESSSQGAPTSKDAIRHIMVRCDVGTASTPGGDVLSGTDGTVNDIQGGSGPGQAASPASDTLGLDGGLGGNQGTGVPAGVAEKGVQSLPGGVANAPGSNDLVVDGNGGSGVPEAVGGMAGGGTVPHVGDC